MPRTKTSFKNYADASRFMRKLHLRTMQDWIDFSKGKNPDGKTRPKDIPSNPWTVYSPQLKEEGKKFSINAFLGSEKTKKTATRKPATTRKVAATRTVVKRAAKAPLSETEKALTYSTTRSMLRKMHVKSQADFNALVRMKLLPSQCPKNPSVAFKQQWKSWKTFLAA